METIGYEEQLTIVDETIDKLAETNETSYNWRKLAEELFELGEIVMKKINKKPGTDQEPPMSKFVEEAGDVVMRISILSRKHDLDDEIDKRITDKFLKYAGYLREGKYIGGI